MERCLRWAQWPWPRPRCCSAPLTPHSSPSPLSQAELGRKMGDLAKPQPVEQGYVRQMAHVKSIAKKWREGAADRLKVEMVDMHAKLKDDWCAHPMCTTDCPRANRVTAPCARLTARAQTARKQGSGQDDRGERRGHGGGGEVGLDAGAVRQPAGGGTTGVHGVSEGRRHARHLLLAFLFKKPMRR
eukprot:2612342-Prymnesium_polylepis.1